MIEGLADFLFAVEAVEEDRIAFHFRVGNFDGDGAAVAEVGGAENGGHAAAGDDAVDAVVIELFAGVDGNPRRACVRQKNSRRARYQRKPVGPPAVHAHAFDAANADQLQADIITAVPLVGNIDQPLCRVRQVAAMARDGRHLRAGHRAVQAVGAEQQNIAREDLVFVDIRRSRRVRCPDERLSMWRVRRLGGFVARKAIPGARARWPRCDRA